MPLVVNCSCGKRLQVRDELAGKKFRCPACQAVLEAPSVDQSGTAVLVASPEAPPVPPPPPKKSRTVAIPAQAILAEPAVAAVAKPVVAAVAQPAREVDASDDEETPKKKKKKKKKSAKSSSDGANWSLIAGLGGGALVLAVLVLAGIFLLPKMLAEVELDEKAIFQGDPEAFVTIDTERLFGTNEGALIQKNLVRLTGLADNNFYKAMDIQLNDVKRISIIVPVLKEISSQAVFVVHTGKKMNRSKMDESKTATREDLNGRGIYRYAADSTCAYLCPGDKTIIFAPNKTSLDAVTKLKGGTPPGTLASSIQQGFEAERQFYVHFKNPEPNAPAPSAAMAPFMPIFKFQTSRITADFGDKSSISIALDYGEQSKASAAILSLKSLPILMKTLQATMFASDPRQKEAFNQYAKLLNDLKTNQDGKMVNLKLDFSGESVGQILAMLQMAQDSPSGFGGPGFGGAFGGGALGGRPGTRPGAGGQSGMQGGGPPGGGPSGKQGGSGPSGKQGGNRPGGGSTPPGASNGGSGAGGGGMSNIRNGSPGGAVMASRGAGDRAFNQSQLRAIGRAMLMYSDSEGGLPAAAICDASGKPLLSWRVAILPYLEQDNLYKQFHLNEPWDSPHNKTLLPLMPKFFSPRNQSGETLTPYRAFVNGGALELNRKNQITSFADGTSQTFLVVETFDMVEWTQPDSLDPNNIPALGSGGKGQFSAVLADGSVRAFPSSMAAADLKAWVTRAGGETINP